MLRVITVTLHPAEDLHVRTALWEPDAVLRAEEVVRVPAGKGLNAARMAAALGAPAIAVTVADPCDRRGAAQLLALSEATLRPFRAGARWRTNLHIDTPTGQFKVNSSAEPIAAERLRPIERWLHRDAQDSVVLFAGTLWPGLPEDSWARLIRAATSAKAAVTVLDSSGSALAAGLGGAPAWLKLNEEEFASVGGSASPAGIADFLRHGTHRGVAVTLGARGAVLGTLSAGRVRIWSGAAPPLEVRDATGAGDAFAAGLATSLARGRGGAAALADAMAAARARVLTAPHDLPRAAVIRDARRSVRVEALAP